MKNLNSILSTFEALPEIALLKENLNEGLLRENILKLFSKFNIEPSEELIQLYEWHNGVSNENIWLLGTATFMPLEDSLQYYELTYNEVKHNSKVDKIGYYIELFPIFFSDDTIYINIDPNKKNYGKIYKKNVYTMIVEPMPIANSLKDLFLMLYEGFKNKIYWYEFDEYGHINLAEAGNENLFGYQMNPTCTYWKMMLYNSILDYEYKNE